MHDEILKQSQNFTHLTGGNAPDPSTWGFTPLSCPKRLCMRQNKNTAAPCTHSHICN